MTALPRHMYRNPLDILIDAENRTCKGCYFKTTAWGKECCTKGKSGKNLKRCKDYKEVRPDDGQ